MRPRSLRARTTLLATALVAVVLAVAGWALVGVLESQLRASKDDLSRARVAELSGQVRDGTLDRQVVDVGDDGVAQVVDADGKVLAASSGLAGSPPVVRVEDVGTSPRLVLLDGVQDDDETEDYRAWAVRVDGPDGPAAALVGDSLESVDEATSALRRGLLVGLPVLAGLTAAGTWLVVSRSLRPVEQVRAEVATVSASDLDHRVPVPPTGDELASLASTMNDMLDRLEAGAVRQREFVADASHELQSPLTSLRTQLEVIRAHPEQDWSSAAADLLQDTLRMERLVRDLLTLARQDAGLEPRRDELVDLDVVLAEELRRVRASTSVEVRATEVDAAPVRGDADGFARLLRNLLENAVAHAASRVTVTLRSNASSAVVEVADDGPGIPDEQRERVFERFARIEGARARGESSFAGTGLGLAIARGIAVRHGGTLVVAKSRTPGAVLELTVPLDDPAPDSAPGAGAGQASEAGAQQKP